MVGNIWIFLFSFLLLNAGENSNAEHIKRKLEIRDSTNDCLVTDTTNNPSTPNCVDADCDAYCKTSTAPQIFGACEYGECQCYYGDPTPTVPPSTSTSNSLQEECDRSCKQPLIPGQCNPYYGCICPWYGGTTPINPTTPSGPFEPVACNLTECLNSCPNYDGVLGGVYYPDIGCQCRYIP